MRAIRTVCGMFLLSCLSAYAEIVWWHGGHSWDVQDLKTSQDGTRLFTATADASIKLWELPSGRLLRTFVAHTNILRTIAINADATRLATGADGGEAIVWDTATGRIIRRFGGHTHVGSLAFSPDSTTLALGSGTSADPTILLWSIQSGALLSTFRGHTSWIHTIQFTLDGTQVLSGSVDRTVKRWDVTSEVPLDSMSPGRAFLRMAFSADGSIAAVPGTNILRYSTADWTPLPPLGTGLRNFFDLVYSRDASMLASAHSDGTLRLWKGGIDPAFSFIATDPAGFGDPDPARLHSVEFSANGRELFSGGADYLVKRWDTETANYLGRIGEFEDGITSVDFSSDGSLVAVAGWRSTRICRATDGHVLLRLPHNQAQRSDFSSDKRFLATASYDGTVKLWDLPSGTLNKTYNAHFFGSDDVTFAPDGTHFASAGRDGIKLWTVDSLQWVKSMPVNTSVVQVVYSKDGGTLLSGDEGGTLRWWRVSDGQMTNSVQAHGNWIAAVRLSPDGSVIATSEFSDPGALKFWTLAGGTLIREITEPYAIGAGSFSPDGSHYAAGIRGLSAPWSTGQIGVWRLSSGQREHILTNETVQVTGVDWSKNGKIIYGRSDAVVALIEAPHSGPSAPTLSLRWSGGTLQLCVDATTNQPVRLEKSTNLIQWDLWAELVGTGDCQTHTVPLNPSASEFFRAIYPQ